MRARAFFDEVVFKHVGDDCLIWPFAIDAKGYGRMLFEGRNHRVSRLVCVKAHGAPPSPIHQAAHSCGKGSSGCVSPHHLSWKTPKENSEDAVAHGTSSAGERHRSAKLQSADVEEIRRREATERRIDLAKEFGVNASTISQVIHHKTWKHI